MQNIKLLEKYKKLSLEYSELCFKYKNLENKYFLSIATNNGIKSFEVDMKSYNETNVKTIDFTYIHLLQYALNIIEENDNILDNLDLENVSYFLMDNETLFYYIGNEENVVIPSNVKTLIPGCFKDNDKIRRVYSNSVKKVYYYAFRNNKNLERIDLKNAVSISNVYQVPNLKELITTTSLESINIEDDLSEQLSIIIEDVDKRYISDLKIVEDFYHYGFFTIKDDSCAAILENAILFINNREGRYISNKEKLNSAIKAMIDFEREYKKLPISIKEILESQGYVYFIMSNYLYGGSCNDNYKVIAYDMRKVKNCFYHEIGHAVDFYLQTKSLENEFLKIYYIEKDNIYSNLPDFKRVDNNYIQYVTKTPEEFFAECFNIYFTDSQQLFLQCPQAYNFIKMILIDLDNNYENKVNTQMNLQIKKAIE